MGPIGTYGGGCANCGKAIYGVHVIRPNGHRWCISCSNVHNISVVPTATTSAAITTFNDANTWYNELPKPDPTPDLDTMWGEVQTERAEQDVQLMFRLVRCKCKTAMLISVEYSKIGDLTKQPVKLDCPGCTNALSIQKISCNTDGYKVRILESWLERTRSQSMPHRLIRSIFK